ncbi:MAG: phosphoribosyl-AMP cyclohydrolase [Candidatus Omnitrophica bacterium]|nr:phosphoribosyl-AMP cyclohydrolase [Candidatus Omnitrophota bacterium]
MSKIDKLNFDEKGLIPAVIQDYKTGKVLTLCYMNKDALEKTLNEGKVYVFRRSKNRIMLKGETSGNIQSVKEVFVDCANNSILIKAEQRSAACHEGYFTCYFRQIDKTGKETIVEKRIFDPKDVYKK